VDSSKKPIAVLGAGAWGTALAVLLARNGQPVRLWDHDQARLTVMKSERNNPFSLPDIVFPENLAIEMTLADAVRDLTDICLVIPSHAFRNVLTQVKSAVSSPRIVWGTKGLDPETGGFLHDTVFSVLSKKTPVAVLSGPSFAKEVALGSPTAVSLASHDAHFSQELIARFHNPFFSVFPTTDLIGVQLAAVVKNILAIAVGVLDGMGFGANTRCAFITRGLAELAKFSEALGGLRETTMSLAGVGDLVLTCTDNQSRNRRFGLTIGQGATVIAALEKVGESVEGYYNAKQLHALAQKNGISAPIIEQVYAILYEHRLPNQLVGVLSS